MYEYQTVIAEKLLIFRSQDVVLFFQPVFQFFQGEAVGRESEFRSYFGHRCHDEKAFGHVWVWNGECGSAESKVVIQQYVDVDDTVTIDAVYTFVGSSQFPFNQLGSVEQFFGEESSFNA